MVSQHFDTIIQGVREKNTNVKPERIRGKPSEIYKDFYWDPELIKPENYRVRFDEFFDSAPELGIDREQFYAFIEGTFKLTDDTFNLMIPQSEGYQMSYHDNIHAKITAITALKIVLGDIALKQKSGELPEALKDPKNINNYLKLAVVAGCTHEVDDWWKLSPEGLISNAEELAVDKLKRQGRLETVRQGIGLYLTENGLNASDLNLLMGADLFKKNLEDSTEDMNKYVLENKFFDPNDSEVLPIFSNLSPDNPELKKNIFIYGRGIRGADFGQVYNKKYIRTVELVTDNQEEIVECSTGPSVLADEFKNWAPDFLGSYRWLNEDGTVNYEAVSVGKFFWDNFASPNLKPVFDSLNRFNKKEGEAVVMLYTIIDKIVQSEGKLKPDELISLLISQIEGQPS